MRVANLGAFSLHISNTSCFAGLWFDMRFDMPATRTVLPFGAAQHGS